MHIPDGKRENFEATRRLTERYGFLQVMEALTLLAQAQGEAAAAAGDRGDAEVWAAYQRALAAAVEKGTAASKKLWGR